MQGATFLQDLAVVMIVAGLVTILFHRFKQPVVLGYIMAGVIVGPHVLPSPLIKDEPTIKTLAALGIVFLMFSLGLEFSLRKLRKVGAAAFVAAALEISLMIWIGYQTGRVFGWDTMDCVFLGPIIAISSTTIVVKTLAALGKAKEPFAHLIYGILIVEDILAIGIIALLSGIAMTGSLETGQVLATLGKLAVFVVVAVVLGLLAVPGLIARVARFKSSEMLLVTVLGLCFGVSLLAVQLGYSVALGAFVIGAVIAEAREIGRIELLTEPIRDMFSAVFFVAIGLMIEPALLLKHALPIAVFTLAVGFGKAITCSIGAFVTGHDLRTSMRVGMGLAQIGEFSFVIASLGLSLGVISGFIYPIAVGVSAVTALLSPYLIRSTDGLVSRFDRLAPREWVNYLALYTEWVRRWRDSRHQNMAVRLIRKWTWQMALNLILVAGLFLIAAFVGRMRPSWLRWVPGDVEGFRAGLWLCSMLAAAPLAIATYRKLQALGMLLGELSAQSIQNERNATAIKAIISNTVLVAGSLGLGLLWLLLSTAVLPSGQVFLALALVLILSVVLLWRTFIRIYAKAQIALTETLSQPPPPRHEETPSPLAGLLREARIERITISAGSAAAGALIRQLALRTRTGTSVVAIERDGVTMVNPGPDDELQAGDQVLLLGSPQQVDAAREYLLAEA